MEESEVGQFYESGYEYWLLFLGTSDSTRLSRCLLATLARLSALDYFSWGYLLVE